MMENKKINPGVYPGPAGKHPSRFFFSWISKKRSAMVQWWSAAVGLPNPPKPTGSMVNIWLMYG